MSKRKFTLFGILGLRIGCFSSAAAFGSMMVMWYTRLAANFDVSFGLC